MNKLVLFNIHQNVIRLLTFLNTFQARVESIKDLLLSKNAAINNVITSDMLNPGQYFLLVSSFLILHCYVTTIIIVANRCQPSLRNFLSVVMLTI